LRRRILVDEKGWKEVYAGLYESIFVKPKLAAAEATTDVSTLP
jgi:hypothetical protein